MEFRGQHASAAERVLGEQLEQAAALVASLAAEPPRDGVEDPVLPESFERLGGSRSPARRSARSRAIDVDER